METHSSILAQRIPSTEKPGRLKSKSGHELDNSWGGQELDMTDGPTLLLSWKSLQNQAGKEKLSGYYSQVPASLLFPVTPVESHSQTPSPDVSLVSSFSLLHLALNFWVPHHAFGYVIIQYLCTECFSVFFLIWKFYYNPIYFQFRHPLPQKTFLESSNELTPHPLLQNSAQSAGLESPTLCCVVCVRVCLC